jgi:uncharacterized protein
MRFHETRSAGNVVTGYGCGFIEVNRTRYETPLLLWPDRLEPWMPPSSDLFTAHDLALLLRMAPEIILLGTGAQIHWRLFSLMAAQTSSVEIMPTA